MFPNNNQHNDSKTAQPTPPDSSDATLNLQQLTLTSHRHVSLEYSSASQQQSDNLVQTTLYQSTTDYYNQDQPLLYRCASGRDETLGLDCPLFRSVGDVAIASPSSPASASSSNFSPSPGSFEFPNAYDSNPKQFGLSLNPKYNSQPTYSSQDEEPEVNLLPPEVPGGYLEPLYHFISCCPPPTILSVLCTSLQQHSVDFSFQQKKYRFKCVIYVGGAKLPFMLSIFRLPSSALAQQQQQQDKKFAIEFQRRSGCVLQFSSIYHRVKKDCEDRGIVEGRSTSSTTSAAASASPTANAPRFTPLPLPLAENKSSVDEARKTLVCLLQMASSEFFDVKQNAFQALSEMSNDPSMVELFGEGEQMFLSCLNHKNEDIKRCAISSLANLTQARNESLCIKIVTSGYTKALCSLVVSSPTLQIVREGARLLYNLVNTLGIQIVKLNPDVVRQMFDSNDEKTLYYARKLGQYFGISPAPGPKEIDLSIPSLSGGGF